MPQDIKEFFQKNDNIKSLPKNHRDDFLRKLRASKRVSVGKVYYRYSYRIAAILVLGILLAYGLINTFKTNDTTRQNVLFAQITSIEKEYLKDIDKEWNNFLLLTKDEKLVKRYKDRLDNLDQDYQAISKQFKADINSILIIEQLVDNLQTRLQLLRDIQKHIKTINQQNEQDEII